MNYDLSVLFILRRAIWYGRVTRSDIIEAFDTTQATASRALEHAATRLQWKNILIRKAKYIESALRVIPPYQASAKTMLQLIEQDPYNFQTLGLRSPTELRIISSHIKAEQAFDETVAHTLLQATIKHWFIDIRYVGLKKGENARWRTIAPVSLECLQGQWRVYAHDLEAAHYPLKFFVFSRIFQAELSKCKIPSRFIWAQGELPKHRYHVTLNPLLTADQKMALQRELGLDNNYHVEMTLPDTFDFKKNYMEGVVEPEKDVIWPIVIDLQRAS